MGFLTGSVKKEVQQPVFFDPMGPTQEVYDPRKNRRYQWFESTGGHAPRADIFNYLSGQQPGLRQWASDFTGRLGSAAANPGFGSQAALARRTLEGAYLTPSSQMEQAMATMRRRAGADAADQVANLQSQYGRAGLGFSTANQQAAQAAQAASTARADELEAATRLQDYQTERGRQMMAGDLLQSAVSTPLEYLSKVPQAVTDPQARIAQIISGLASGGQIATPDMAMIKKPGALDYLVQLVGAAAGAMG